LRGANTLSCRKVISSEYGWHGMSILIDPLPEMRRASLAGVILQKPRRGTMPRRSRSTRGIGVIFNSAGEGWAYTGAFGRNLSSRTRRRYSAERISSPSFAAWSEALAGGAELISLANIGVSNAGELANPAASVPLAKKSLRFMFPHSISDPVVWIMIGSHNTQQIAGIKHFRDDLGPRGSPISTCASRR